MASPLARVWIILSSRLRLAGRDRLNWHLQKSQYSKTTRPACEIPIGRVLLNGGKTIAKPLHCKYKVYA